MENKVKSEPALKTVMVFKTSLKYKKQIKPLAKSLNQYGKWNFDLEDCDNILRVEAHPSHAKTIISLMQIHGYYCEELQ